MGKATCDSRANQLFDVVQFSANGEPLGCVSSAVTLSGALSCATGFNAHSRNGAVAVVLEVPEHESVLVELELGDFCQARGDESDDKYTLWEWCQLGCDVEAVDTIALDSACHRLVCEYLCVDGDDCAALCEQVPVDVQLQIWRQLRILF